jgi:hypothetical protein
MFGTYYTEKHCIRTIRSFENKVCIFTMRPCLAQKDKNCMSGEVSRTI